MDIGPVSSTEKAPWPKTMPEQIAAVRVVLHDMGEASPDQIARSVVRARTASVQPLLESLAALGYATCGQEGQYPGKGQSNRSAPHRRGVKRFSFGMLVGVCQKS